jgi:hypothetical protein
MFGMIKNAARAIFLLLVLSISAFSETFFALKKGFNI